MKAEFKPGRPGFHQLCVAGLAILLYANTFGHEFALDDAVVFKDNKYVAEGFAGIGKILTQDTFAGFIDTTVNLSGGRYRPGSVITFAIESQFWGNDRPWISHVINTLLYAATGCLLYLLIVQVLEGKQRRLAFFASLIFIAHPVHTEAVANIKGRDELLCFLLVLAAFYMLLRYLDDKKTGWMVGAAIVYLLSLFTKENAITFLAVFPLTLYIVRKETAKRALQLTLPFLGMALLFVAVRTGVVGMIGNRSTTDVMLDPFAMAASGEKYATIMHTLGRYLWLQIIPHPLVFDYSYNQIPLNGWGSPRALIPLAAYLALVVVAVRGLRSRRIESLLIIYYIATLSIVSNIVFPIGAPMADRFLYIPSLGFCIGLALLICKRLPAKAVVPTLAALLVVYGVRTLLRNPAWKNNWTLVTADVKHSPNSARVHASLGEQRWFKYEEDRQANAVMFDRAREAYLRALEINPRYFDAYRNLALLYGKTGDHATAMKYLEEAVSLNGTDADLRYNLGLASSRAGHPQKAALHLAKAIEGRPNNAKYQLVYGEVLYKIGNHQDAIKALRRAMELDKNLPGAHHQIGKAMLASGDVAGAENHLRNALTLAKSAATHSDLGVLLFQTERLDEAAEQFSAALAIDPNLAPAVSNLGSVRNKQGKVEESMTLFRRAIDLDPGYEMARANLANALFAKGEALFKEQKWSEALAPLREALEVSPKATQSLFYIGFASYNLRRYPEAVEALSKFDAAHPGNPQVQTYLQKARDAQQ
jgi:tetratricopeptide (TPR) repeat protein